MHPFNHPNVAWTELPLSRPPSHPHLTGSGLSSIAQVESFLY